MDGGLYTVRMLKPILRGRRRARTVSGVFMVQSVHILAVQPTAVTTTPATATSLGFRVGFQQVPNNPPIDLNSTAELTIAENQPIGTIVGEFNATDRRAGRLPTLWSAGKVMEITLSLTWMKMVLCVP